MVIGERFRSLRKAKNLSQADIQKRTGLVCPYLSRIENGHLTPSIATLEKLARALEIPIWRIFYNGEDTPEPLAAGQGKTGKKLAWGSAGKEAAMLAQFRECLGRVSKNDLKLLMHMARKMAR